MGDRRGIKIKNNTGTDGRSRDDVSHAQCGTEEGAKRTFEPAGKYFPLRDTTLPTQPLSLPHLELHPLTVSFRID